MVVGVTAWGRHLEVLSGGRRWRDAVATRLRSAGVGKGMKLTGGAHTVVT
jgi:hypothetical protein